MLRLIFRTIENEANNSLKSISLLGLQTKNLISTYRTIKTNGFSGLFKNQDIKISKDLLSQFNKFSTVFNNSGKSAQVVSEELGNIDSRIINYAKNCKNGSLSQQEFVQSLKATTTGVKLQNLAMNALSTALNIGLSAAIGIAINAYQNYNQKQKEIHDNAIQSIADSKAELNNITQLYTKYSELSETFKTNAGVKNELKNATSDLLNALGYEYFQIDELIKKYGSLDNAINSVTLDSLSNTKNNLTTGYDTARNDFVKAADDNFWGRNVISTSGKEEVQYYEILEKANLISRNSYGSAGGSIILPDAKDEASALNNYQILDRILNTLNKSVEEGTISREDLSKSKLFKNLNERKKDMQEKYDTYISSINALDENLAATSIINTLKNKALPDNMSDFNNFKQDLIDSAVKSGDYVGTRKDIENAFNNMLSKMPDFTEFYDGSINLQNALTRTLSKVQKLSGGFDQLKKVQDDISNGGDFDYSTILNNDNFKNEFSMLGDAYFDFIETITNFPNDISSCQNALNRLATEYLQNSKALDSVTEETKEATIAMLEQMGITNASKMVEARLSAQKLASAKIDKNLTDLTYEQINALLKEANCADFTKNYLQNLALAKIDINNTKINTDEDVNNILAIANAAGASTAQMFLLQNTLSEIQSLENENDTPVQYKKVGGKFSPLYKDTLQTDKQTKITALKAKLSNQLNEIKAGAFNLSPSDFYAKYDGNSKIETPITTTSEEAAEALNEFSEQIDWFERLTSRLSKIFDRFQRIFSNAGKSWHTRFDALSSAMANINEQITVQSEAFDDYQTRFDSYNLDSHYKSLIANGQIGSETITDESLKNAIDECIQLYDNAQNCQDQLIELNNQLSDLAMQKFDNTASQFEEILGKIEAVNTQLRNEADLLETKGYMASSSLYETLMEQETSNLNQLYKERQSLINAFNEAMNSGAVEKYSENWYSMQAAIDEVTVSLQDSRKTLAEYQNELRQLSWDAFDFTRDHVTNLIDESEFLVNLLKAAGTTDESGNLNANGTAAQSLLAQKYELDLKQAEEYAAEIGKIDEEIAKDPYNTTLLERRQELIKAQQDSILAAQDEKDAIKDLLSEAYSAYQEHLNKTIDKYKDLMNTMKDAWEYEKTIAEKTRNLAALQKQYAAYQGDDSEEGHKNVQQLKEQIDEAENDLAQTEYEQLISDTEKLLDNISTETEEYFNQRLDQIDSILNQIISQGTADSMDISKTIKDTAANAGYILSNDMKTIWDSGETHRTALQNAVDAIKEFTEKLLENANKQAQDAVQDISGQQSEQGAASSSADGTDTGSSDETGSDNDSYTPASDVDWLYSKDYYPKDQLNTETSVIDRLKWHDFDSSFDARSQYYSQMGGDGTYYATYGQNVWMLNWMKEHGYRSGAKRLSSLFNGLAWTQDGGPELIRTSDGAVLSPVGNGGTIFNTQMTDNLWKWGQINPLELHSAAHLTGEPLYRTARTPASITSTVSGGIHISLPNVTDYEDFCQQAQKDPKFEKMIQAMTLEQTLGKNSLNRLQF